MKKLRFRAPHKRPRYRIQFLVRPGWRLSDGRLATLIAALRDCAGTCFDELPAYQVMAGTREELADKVLAIAWRKDGRIAGFCSTILLPVWGIGEVLHLGLTCVRPEDRSTGLTHILTRKAVAGYLLRRRLIGKLWVSNCAAVLSSLGNVALHFENVYPSPFAHSGPSENHIRIATAIDELYRQKIYIAHNATFDRDSFVFRRSVMGTCFEKDGGDQRFFHRQPQLNNYYGSLMEFDRGDEVLQVGYVSTMVAVKHLYRKKFKRPAKARRVATLPTTPDRAVKTNFQSEE